LKSLEDLKKMKEETIQAMQLKEQPEPEYRVTVGLGTCGIAAGARAVYNAFVEEVNNRKIKYVTVVGTGCAGICKNEPLVEITGADGITYTYQNLTPEKAKAVTEQHLVQKKPVEAWLLATGRSLL